MYWNIPIDDTTDWRKKKKINKKMALQSALKDVNGHKVKKMFYFSSNFGSRLIVILSVPISEATIFFFFDGQENWFENNFNGNRIYEYELYE